MAVTLGLFSLLWFFPQVMVYKIMGAEGLHNQMVQTRDYGIKMAQENGDYRCCIEPACTMCYSEGNKWNYGKAGTCACDEFVARGEEPCPQCAKSISCDTSKEDDLESGTGPETCLIDLEDL